MDRLSNWLKYYLHINFCLCSMYFYFAHVNFLTCCVWNTNIFYGEHQIYFLGENRFLRWFFGLNMPFWYTCFLHILSLLVLCQNYMLKCFNHFYKIKIHKSVKNHPWNLKMVWFKNCGLRRWEHPCSGLSIWLSWPWMHELLSTMQEIDTC